MYEYRIKEIVHFVDGDTFDCVLDLGFDITHKIRVRMHGINTPESRTRDLVEKEKGLASKKHLIELLSEEDCDLVLQTKERGKYGRWLGVVIKRFASAPPHDENVNDVMIQEGYAVPYFGGKR